MTLTEKIDAVRALRRHIEDAAHRRAFDEALLAAAECEGRPFELDERQRVFDRLNHCVRWPSRAHHNDMMTHVPMDHRMTEADVAMAAACQFGYPSYGRFVRRWLDVAAARGMNQRAA